MRSLLQQLKKRRLDLGLKQSDMMMRIGVSRQQYQHLESKGNPRLDTLELIVTGLNSEIMLIPGEKLNAVLAVIESDEFESESTDGTRSDTEIENDLSYNPWHGLLGEDS